MATSFHSFATVAATSASGAWSHTLPQPNELWKVLLCLLPLVVAFGIAASRVVDYWHHFSDIVAGSLIGCAFAYLSFRHNFVYYAPRPPNYVPEPDIASVRV
jgi:membrane-associated phospholipid phosphatase